MDMQRPDSAGAAAGFDPALANGVRLATAIDPRMAEVWMTVFSANLEPEELASQLGWFLRMAYLRGYHDGLCEPEAGSLYRALGVAVPQRNAARPRITRQGSTKPKEA